MAIVNTPQQQVQSPEAVMNQIKAITTRMYHMIKRDHTQAFNLIWSNAQYTPALIVAAFGPDAVALFQLSSALQNVLANADPSYYRLMPLQDFIINADGTVTIIEPAETPVP
jgi:hypothetical protein